MTTKIHVLTEREAIKLGDAELAGHTVAINKFARMTWEGTVTYAEVYNLGYIVLDEDNDFWIGESQE